MADEKQDQEAQQETADTYYRHGEPDPSVWQAAEAVTGRPNDLGSVTPEPALANSTFASRAKQQAVATKAIPAEETEDKAVRSSTARRKGK